MARVAVITAAKNASAFIGDTLDSIAAQTFADWEHVVVDDGSTDDTASIVNERAERDPRVRLIRLDASRGPFAAANVAVELADAEFIARIDADDLALPNRLELQLRRLEETGAKACTGAWQILDANGTPGGLRKAPSHSNAVIKWQLWIRNGMPHSTLLIDTETMHGFGNYGPERVAEDFRLWAKLARAGLIAAVDEPVLHYRTSDEQITAVAGARDQPERLRVRLDHITACAPDGGWTLDDAREFRYLGRAAPFGVARGMRLLDAWEAKWRSDPSVTASDRAELEAFAFNLWSRHLRHAAARQPLHTVLATATNGPALLREFLGRRR